jgi:hypothetical protein
MEKASKKMLKGAITDANRRGDYVEEKRSGPKACLILGKR